MRNGVVSVRGLRHEAVVSMNESEDGCRDCQCTQMGNLNLIVWKTTLYPHISIVFQMQHWCGCLNVIGFAQPPTYPQRRPYLRADSKIVYLIKNQIYATSGTFNSKRPFVVQLLQKQFFFPYRLASSISRMSA